MSYAKMKPNLIYLGIFAAVLLFFVFIYECPVYAVFGIRCPGCGITRAYISALQFDFSAAFAHHPLFFIVAPLVSYVLLRNKLKKPLDGKTETAILVTVTVLFAGVYVYRILNGSFTV